MVDLEPRLGSTGLDPRTDLRSHVLYVEANENVARFVAYSGSYLFWTLMSVITGGILLVG